MHSVDLKPSAGHHRRPIEYPLDYKHHVSLLFMTIDGPLSILRDVSVYSNMYVIKLHMNTGRYKIYD